jgi:cellulose biosynthesis protein BcsQ
MEKETLFIAFSTQKGGVGKTAFTVLMSSYLHYLEGLEIMVVDCDYPQHSIFEMRQRDMEQVMKDDFYKQMAYQQFTSLKRKAYPVEKSHPDKAISLAEELIDQALKKPDIIFFDLPGKLQNGEFSIHTYADSRGERVLFFVVRMFKIIIYKITFHSIVI